MKAAPHKGCGFLRSCAVFSPVAKHGRIRSAARLGTAQREATTLKRTNSLSHLRRLHMTTVTHPDKRDVRQYMTERAQKESPMPSPEEIRRQLGWHLIQSNGRMPEVRD